MRLNADFAKRVVRRPDDTRWSASPMPGVDRKMLDRVGGEVARATSIVRYAPGSRFASHSHGGGEEFLVLDGVFSDESGHYPAGTYVRNPIGTAHAPYSDPGCTLFVKLYQFEPGDTIRKAIDTRNAVFIPGPEPGLSVLSLHEFGGERAMLIRWAPGAKPAPRSEPGGQEILVLDGVLSDQHGDYPAGSWLRIPPMADNAAYPQDGCLTYVKLGHLTADKLARFKEAA